MKIKLDSKVATAAGDALGLHADALYNRLGRRIIVVAELAATERNQVAADEDKDAWVKLQVKHLEVAVDRAEDPVREAMRVLYTQRTAYGTLNADGDIELGDKTLDGCAGDLTRIENARLHVAMEEWARYARAAAGNRQLTAEQLRNELTTVSDALRAVVYPVAVSA